MRNARLENLHQLVVAGEDAKLVKRYADAWLAEEKEKALAALLRPDSDPQMVKMQYRAACSFARKIDEAISTGDRKRLKIEEMKREEQG